MSSNTIDNSTQTQVHVLTVTALNQRSRQLLETHFGQVWVEGEISNLTRPSSGHWYFTLKDAKAQVRCAMFRNRNQRIRFRPENGMQVTVRGRLSLYEMRGDYQLIGEHLEESGIGALQRAFEQLKLTLAQRGWFDDAHKKPLPALPKHIGVVTSPSGAALHDILIVLHRRFPATRVTVIPTAVQGIAAPQDIADAIDCANRLGPTLQPAIDALIVGRGGGSLEDLWAFNEEIVAEAIFNSHLPVVSAVGHETDFSIADFVADHRAPTPSAAAELLSPDQAQWLSTLTGYQDQLLSLLQRLIGQRQQQLAHLQRRLKHPGAQLQEYSQRLDEAELRLRRALERQLQQHGVRLEYARQRLRMLSPGHRIPTRLATVANQHRRLTLRMNNLLREKQALLQKQAELLDSVSPLNTLQRGYAIVQDEHGNIVRSSGQLDTGDTIHLRLGQGELDAKVL
jgi:exodeoxyribonuclease VII large subunit